MGRPYFMKYENQLILPGLFLLAAAGFLLPFWPLSAFAIVLAGLLRWSVFAFALGLLLDIAWGAPTGVLEVLMFPFTLLAFCSILARIFASRYLLRKSLPEKL